MDKIHREVFIPDEILNEQKDKQLFIATELQRLIAQLFTFDLQPYVLITEARTHRQQEDGITRVGKVYIAHICVGQVPLVQGTNGETIQDLVDSKPITVGNN